MPILEPPPTETFRGYAMINATGKREFGTRKCALCMELLLFTKLSQLNFLPLKMYLDMCINPAGVQILRRSGFGYNEIAVAHDSITILC